MLGRTLALRVRRTSDSDGRFARCWCQGLSVFLFPVFGFNLRLESHALLLNRDNACITYRERGD